MTTPQSPPERFTLDEAEADNVLEMAETAVAELREEITGLSPDAAEAFIAGRLAGLFCDALEREIAAGAADGLIELVNETLDEPPVRY